VRAHALIAELFERVAGGELRVEIDRTFRSPRPLQRMHIASWSAPSFDGRSANVATAFNTAPATMSTALRANSRVSPEVI
jgi:hypothetical protein